jgi:SpoVK/Ycf46/Vps4 family AAA+-type ATPase
MIALEAVGGSTGQRYLVEQVEDLPLDRVGGQAAALHELLSALTARLTDPDVAADYGLSGKRAVMLAGSPGCGKTLLARACAAEIQRRTGKTCRFAVVKPGEWLSPFVGTTEENIRKCFQAMRDASRDGLVVLFLDEIESIGRIRGRSIAQHDDRFLTTLLAELDGFSDRGEVAVIAATNRKDLLDPALVDRLCDVDIAVARPDMRGAREIFAVHLARSLRYYANGVPAEETREQMIDRGVSRLYGPNADNEICSLHLRDGKTRTIAARELVSGRMIEQICRSACSHAFNRHIAGGGEGLRGADIDHAVEAGIERLRTTLTAHNARAYLDDLPQDVDVVRVEPIARPAKSVYRYLHA